MSDNVGELKKMLYDMAKANPEKRFHSLYDKIWRMDVLTEAWETVKSNHGSPGIDGVKIEDIDREIEEVLTQLQAELRTRAYEPAPLKRVYIPKANGKMRGLAIPTVRDRIVQAAVKIVMEPIFESNFEPVSFGSRPNRSAHDAVNEVAKYLNYGCEHVIDVDIRGCFDNIPRDKLMDQVALRISDGSVLHLIRRILDAGIMEGSEIIDTEKGTPQGSPLSPLLANIYLDKLDKAWKLSGLTYRYGANAHLIRYADDVVIVVGKDVNKAMEKLQEIISSMGLELSKEKTRTVKANEGFDFLGFPFTRVYSHRRRRNVTRWFPSEKAESSIRQCIREVTERSRLATTLPDEAREILIPICHHQEGLPLLTHLGNSIEEGESEVHVLLLRLQSLRTEHHKGIAMWKFRTKKR